MSFHFLHPNILWALAVLLLPILIHLFNFKRFERVYFSNLKFLRQLNTEHKRKSKLKKWLILILRLLTLATIIFAFAQPYQSNEPKPASNQSRQKPIVLFVDNSFSMNAETEKGVALEVAKNLAFNLINSMPDNTSFKVYNQDISHLINSFHKNQAIERIQAIQPSPKSIKLSQILEKIKIDQPLNTEYFVISDFQKSQTDFENIRSDSTMAVNLIPVQVESSQNLFLDSCWLDRTFLDRSKNQTLHVIVKNASNQNYSKIPIQLSINDSVRSISNFDIQGNSEQNVDLQFRSRTIGNYSGEVEIKDFPITYDNNLFFSYAINAKAKILSINKEKPNRYISKLFHLSKNFFLKNLSQENVYTQNIDEYQLVILNELESIDKATQQQLTSYLSKGGHILILPAEKMSKSINIFLSKISARQYNVIHSRKQRLSKIELESEEYKNVFSKIGDNARLPDIYKYYSLKPSSDKVVETLWKTAGGDPLLSKTRHKKGILYQMSMDLNDNWTNLALHPIFVPTLINMSRSSNKIPIYYILGENSVIPTQLPQLNIDDVPLHILNENLLTDIIPEQISHFDNGVLLYPRNQIKFAGNYKIVQNDSLLNLCSFNYSRNESVPEFYTRNQLDNEILKSKGRLLLISIDKMKPYDVFNEKGDVTEYWQIFLFFSILFFIAESLIHKKEIKTTHK